MAFKKIRYRYNPQTLSYERIETGIKTWLLKGGAYVITGLVFAVFFIFLSYTYIDSPKEKMLKRENEQLLLQYAILNKKMDQVSTVLEDIQERDDNIYRVIFEAEPIPDNVRKAGFGGINRYNHLEGFESSGLIIETTGRLDKLAKQLYIQSKSFDEVYEMARQKGDMLASIPAIQPLSNNDLTYVASGFGYRVHPIYKTTMFHGGMDFTAPTGTEVYSTGNGVVQKAEQSLKGFGTHVIISHGYGYETIYGHLDSFRVYEGQKVKRGEVIGYVGNTGTSTAPHLHYEVHKNGQKIDPVNFYFNDLSPEQYARMIQIASDVNQSFD